MPRAALTMLIKAVTVRWQHLLLSVLLLSARPLRCHYFISTLLKQLMSEVYSST